MRKNLAKLIVFACLFFAACNNQEKESASSVAKKWCELNGKAHRAEEGTEKEKATAELKKYEEDMGAKYKNDKSFMDEVEKEVEKCEDESEGRK